MAIITNHDVGDYLYPSDNSYDIPCLSLDGQAGALELPFAPVGVGYKTSRAKTLHFYVDDYRFATVWNNPAKIINTNIKQVVEVNYSIFQSTPVARGLERIYKKRWLSRYWQNCGLKVYVDLNVSAKFADFNRLGVPHGYNAFCTRGYRGRLDGLVLEHRIACEISGLDTPNLIVYGGGKEIHEYCMKHSLLYVADFITDKNIKQ